MYQMGAGALQLGLKKKNKAKKAKIKTSSELPKNQYIFSKKKSTWTNFENFYIVHSLICQIFVTISVLAGLKCCLRLWKSVQRLRMLKKSVPCDIGWTKFANQNKQINVLKSLSLIFSTIKRISKLEQNKSERPMQHCV